MVTARKQLGWRLPKIVVDRFIALCEDGQLRPSEVLEEFMRRVLEVGDVRETMNMVVPTSRETLLARELRAKAMIARIQGSIKDFVGDAYSEYKELLQILPLISDPALIEEIKDLSLQLNKALKGS